MSSPEIGELEALVHALRSPLTIVEGFAGLLERSGAQLSADEREHLRRIHDACEQMRELLDAADRAPR